MYIAPIKYHRLKLNKLSLIVNKTKPPQRQINIPNLVIDNTEIKWVNEFNFLGIMIDQNLN